MPEANVLYSVTAAVVLGLITWVAVVLKTAKEPWARDVPKAARADDDVPLEKPEAAVVASAENAMTSEGGPAPDAKAEAAADAKAATDVKADAEEKAEAADAKAEEKADAEEKAEAQAEAAADANVEAKAEADAKV